MDLVNAVLASEGMLEHEVVTSFSPSAQVIGVAAFLVLGLLLWLVTRINIDR